MRLKKYLNENRSQEIKREKAEEILKKNCSEALDRYHRGYKIFRVDLKFKDFYLLKPGNSIRKSKNTSNHYTLFLNNHESWKKYPKRQVICSGGKPQTSHSGFYYIFPFNGAKIGICPTEDIWWSFETNLKKLKDVDSLLDFNLFLNFDLNISDKNWKEFWREAQEKELTDNLTVTEWMEKYMTPEANGFRLTNIKNFDIKKGSESKEIWTDSNCLLIRYDVMEW